MRFFTVSTAPYKFERFVFAVFVFFSLARATRVLFIVCVCVGHAANRTDGKTKFKKWKSTFVWKQNE